MTSCPFDILSLHQVGEDIYFEGNVVLVITIHTSEPMPSVTRQIRIYIKPKDEKKKFVSITTIADCFQHLQNILYQVCDEVIDNEFRKTGRYPKKVKEYCDLVLKNITISSADVAVGLSYTQIGLPLEGFEKTFGEQAITITNNIIEIVRESDDIFPELEPIISDEDRRKRILSEIDKIWPDDSSNYDYSIAVGEKKLNPMHPQRKPKIREALETEITQIEKTVFGRLIVLNFTKKHTCQIETAEGRYDCKYSPDLVDIIKNNGGEIVSLSGKLTEFKTILIESASDLTRINIIPLNEIIVDEENIVLKRPIDLDIEYDKENDEYVVENENLNVFVINDDLKEAIESLKEQIGILWVEFVKEDPSNLTDSAIEFRKTLISILGADL
jgi:hypothetical protein